MNTCFLSCKFPLTLWLCFFVFFFAAPYVKVYLVNGKKCIAKAKTSAARRTLDPLYQQQLAFREAFQGCILQVSHLFFTKENNLTNHQNIFQLLFCCFFCCYYCFLSSLLKKYSPLRILFTTELNYYSYESIRLHSKLIMISWITSWPARLRSLKIQLYYYYYY